MTHEPEWSPDRADPGADLTCADCQPRLPDYLAGALTPVWRVALTRHLATCAACRDEEREWQAVQRALLAAASGAQPTEAELTGAVDDAWARLQTALTLPIEADSAAPAQFIATLKATRTARTTTYNESRRQPMDDTTQRPEPVEAITTSADTPVVTRRPRGMNVWLSGLAAALIVALLVGTLLTLPTLRRVSKGGSTGAHASAHASTPQVSSCAASAISASLPPHAYLLDISMVSPDEGWAVGEIRDSKDNWPISTLILRYHLCQWTVEGPTIPNRSLDSVSMVSPTEGWAVGGINERTAGSGSVGPVLHYTGGQWKVVTLPDDRGPYGMGAFSNVRMFSADEGWITEDTSGVAGKGTAQSRLFHYQNGQWRVVALPTGLKVAQDIVPVASDDAWLLGYTYRSGSDGQNNFAHYQHGRWTVSPPPANILPAPGNATPTELRMLSPRDGWAFDPPIGQGIVDLNVAHYDGSSWAEVRLAVDPKTQQIEVIRDNEIWAFNFSGGSAQFYNGVAWRSVSWPDINLYAVSSMTRVAAGEYWAIGLYDVAITQPDGSVEGVPHTVLLHYLNGAWTEYK